MTSIKFMSIKGRVFSLVPRPPRLLIVASDLKRVGLVDFVSLRQDQSYHTFCFSNCQDSEIHARPLHEILGMKPKCHRKAKVTSRDERVYLT